jgi:hypothetical protein
MFERYHAPGADVPMHELPVASDASSPVPDSAKISKSAPNGRGRCTGSSYKVPAVVGSKRKANDWLASSCGEEPHITDDIASWRQFRSRIRTGDINDHLTVGMSRSSSLSESSFHMTGAFYFGGDSAVKAGKENLENSNNAIVVDLLPLLKPVEDEESAASGARQRLRSSSGIFDLDM